MTIYYFTFVFLLYGLVFYAITNLPYTSNPSDLAQERIAWQLSVEPYKCDNTRLLAECNRLHLDLLRQREDARLQLCSVRHKNRTLETDTIALTEQNAELCAQLADMSAALAASSKTGPTAGRSTDLKRKAFVSTVRSKSVFPDYTRAANKAGTPACAAARARSASCKRSTACSGCGDGPRNDRIVVQRLEDEVQSKTEFVDELRKQVSTLALNAHSFRPGDSCANVYSTSSIR